MWMFVACLWRARTLYQCREYEAHLSLERAMLTVICVHWHMLQRTRTHSGVKDARGNY